MILLLKFFDPIRYFPQSLFSKILKSFTNVLNVIGELTIIGQNEAETQ